MRSSGHLLLSLGLATAAVGLARNPVTAQDPVQVRPEKYRVLVENEAVRLLEFRDKPGDQAVMHSHSDYLGYALHPFRRRVLFPDGSAREIEMTVGEPG